MFLGRGADEGQRQQGMTSGGRFRRRVLASGGPGGQMALGAAFLPALPLRRVPGSLHCKIFAPVSTGGNDWRLSCAPALSSCGPRQEMAFGTHCTAPPAAPPDCCEQPQPLPKLPKLVGRRGPQHTTLHAPARLHSSSIAHPPPSCHSGYRGKQFGPGKPAGGAISGRMAAACWTRPGGAPRAAPAAGPDQHQAQGGLQGRAALQLPSAHHLATASVAASCRPTPQGFPAAAPTASLDHVGAPFPLICRYSALQGLKHTWLSSSF